VDGAGGEPQGLKPGFQGHFSAAGAEDSADGAGVPARRGEPALEAVKQEMAEGPAVIVL